MRFFAKFLLKSLLVLMTGFACQTEVNASANEQYSLGLQWLKKPAYLKAYDCFQVSLKNSRAENNKQLEAESLLQLGKLSCMLSRIDTAIFFLNAGVELIKRTQPNNKKLLARFYLGLGEAYKIINDIERAGGFQRLAIKLSEEAYGKQNIQTAYAYSCYSSYFTFKQQPDSELVWSNKAYQIASIEKTKAADPYCFILIQHATAIKEFYCRDAYGVEVYFPQIRSLYKRALYRARSFYGSPSFEEGMALQGLANTYTDNVIPFYQNHHPDADANWLMADSLYKETTRIKECALGKWNSSVVTTRYTHALIYWYHPSIEKNILSLNKFNDAMALLDSSWHADGPLSVPTSSFTNNPYYLSVLLTNKAELLSKIFYKTKDVKYLIAQWNTNLTRLLLWDKILSTLSEKNIGSVISIWNRAPFEEAIDVSYRLFEITGDIKYAEEIYDFAEKSRNNDYTQLLIKRGVIKNGNYQLKSHSPPLQVLQKLIPPSTAYFVYIQAPNKDLVNSFGLVITNKRYAIVKLDKKAITDSLQQRLTAAMQSSNAVDYNTASTSLFRKLLNPLIMKAGQDIRNIVICPSGTYSQVPFEALTRNPLPEKDFRKMDYIFHYYNFSYTLNAEMAFKQQKNEVNPKGLAAFVPKVDSLPFLLFSENQVKELQSSYVGSFYFSKEATLANFISNCSSKSVIQVSTHSMANDMEGSEGVLLFSDTALQLGSLYGKNFPLDLCIISACQSGSGKQEYGIGTRSFARSFAYAGATATISTLWRVDDKATAGLLTHMYAYMDKGMCVRNALINAKKKQLINCKTSEEANPFYWAGLIYCGNWDLSIQLEENKALIFKQITVFFISLLLVLLYLIKRGKKLRK